MCTAKWHVPQYHHFDIQGIVIFQMGILFIDSGRDVIKKMIQYPFFQFFPTDHKKWLNFVEIVTNIPYFLLKPCFVYFDVQAIKIKSCYALYASKKQFVRLPLQMV